MITSTPTNIGRISHQQQAFALLSTMLPQDSETLTFTATTILGRNVRFTSLLSKGPPTLTFDSAVITGLRISHTLHAGGQIVFAASGPVTASGITITTSFFNNLKTALSGSLTLIDILRLLAEQTIPTLNMQHVNLLVDTRLQTQKITLRGYSLTIQPAP
jgi:hypothetical protein